MRKSENCGQTGNFKGVFLLLEFLSCVLSDSKHAAPPKTTTTCLAPVKSPLQSPVEFSVADHDGKFLVLTLRPSPPSLTNPHNGNLVYGQRLRQFIAVPLCGKCLGTIWKHYLGTIWELFGTRVP